MSGAALSVGRIVQRVRNRLRRGRPPTTTLPDRLLREGETGRTLVETVAAYLDHGLRPAETAAALHLHPNSLRKRLKRYEELTGADLRSMDDLVAIWWALRRREMRAFNSSSSERFSPSGLATRWATSTSSQIVQIVQRVLRRPD